MTRGPLSIQAQGICALAKHTVWSHSNIKSCELQHELAFITLAKPFCAIHLAAQNVHLKKENIHFNLIYL